MTLYEGNLTMSLAVRLSTLLAFAILILPNASNATEPPIRIGLDADMSSGAAKGGEAIRRGVALAIKEVNDNGGVFGRPLELIVRDHRGNPARGVDNITELAAMKDVVAVVGGIHTPVAMRELPAIHKSNLIFLVPWAAGTPVVENGFEPNFVFRVSVRDQFAGGFLVENALKSGHKKLGLLFEKTGWGRSNEKAVKAALLPHGLAPAAIEWFGWGATDISPQIKRLQKAGADVIILVANPREGGIVVADIAAMPQDMRLPLLSHWGITGGDFFKANKNNLARVDLSFLQTFSFFDPPIPDRANHLWTLYKTMFTDAVDPGDAFSPVGTAHAYDLVHILVAAIKKAGTIDRVLVQAALETLPFHSGVMRDYAPPFTKNRHDALDATNFRIGRYEANGQIRIVKTGTN